MKFKECLQKNVAGIKSIFDYARTRDQKIYDIPLAPQNLVMERFEKTREDPYRLIDWDEAKESLKNR